LIWFTFLDTFLNGTKITNFVIFVFGNILLDCNRHHSFHIFLWLVVLFWPKQKLQIL
jgi:hypothetical protein